jgi:sporulation protein YqfC
VSKIKNFLSKKISDGLELPMEMIGGIPSVYIKGNIEVTVTECENIIKYDDDEIILKLNDFNLLINGSNLSLKTFYATKMVITGTIKKVQLGNDI